MNQTIGRDTAEYTLVEIPTSGTDSDQSRCVSLKQELGNEISNIVLLQNGHFPLYDENHSKNSL